MERAEPEPVSTKVLRERQRDQVPIFVAKVASAGMIIIGFGLFVLVQL